MLRWSHVPSPRTGGPLLRGDETEAERAHLHRMTGPDADGDGRASERGMIMVMACLSLLGILLLGTLVASGSLAYSQRRNAQNATDAASSAGARALDQALFFGGPLDGVDTTVAGLVADHKAQGYECWLVHGNGARMVSAIGAPVPCSDSTTIRIWRDYLAKNRPTTAQPSGIEVIVLDRKPSLFGGLGGQSEVVTARAGAKATVQTVTEVSAPWVICANPAYVAGNLFAPPDLLRTGPDGPDLDTLGDFIFNADGTVDVDPAKAEAANYLNGGDGIALDGAKVAECGAGSNFDGKGIPNMKFRLPGIAQVQQGTGFSSLIHDAVVSTNPCPTPLPQELDGCEILIPMAISGSAMKMQLVAAGVFKVTGTGKGQVGYYGKYVGKAQFVLGTHTTTAPVSGASLRVIRIIEG